METEPGECQQSKSREKEEQERERERERGKDGYGPESGKQL